MRRTFPLSILGALLLPDRLTTNRACCAVTALLVMRPFILLFSLAALDNCLNVSISASCFATDICLFLAADYRLMPRYQQPLYASLPPSVRRYHADTRQQQQQPQHMPQHPCLHSHLLVPRLNNNAKAYIKHLYIFDSGTSSASAAFQHEQQCRQLQRCAHHQRQRQQQQCQQQPQRC